MAKIIYQRSIPLSVSKTLCFLMFPLMLSACTDGNPKNTDNALSNAETIQPIKTTQTIKINDTTVEKIIDTSYINQPFAYLIDGELFFHNLVNNKKINFTEEPEAIFNFTFDTEGTTLYYTVERDDTLWLKSANLSDSNVSPQWIVDWQLKKDECITETYGEASPLLYHQGKLLMQHGFNWDTYYFSSAAIHSIGTQNISRRGLDYDLIQTYSGALTFDKTDQYFKTIKQQLYYTGNNAKVCLTDKLNFVAEKVEGDEEVEIEFTNFILSPDKTKILFGAIVGWGDLPHGPYSIANADGSQQMMLKHTDIGSSKQPAWLSNNRVIFVDDNDTLFVANNDEGSIEAVAKNVSSYVVK